MTTWVKVHNSMPTNPKVLAAGDRAAWLAVCGFCYSNEHLTNGFIARHTLPVVAPGVKNPEALASKLVTAGLWHEVDGGWNIHDYEKHQRLAEEIRERRGKDSERKAATRSGGSPHGQTADSARIPSGVRTDPRGRDRGRSQEIEIEIEVEKKNNNNNAELRSAVIEIFVYWQERCKHQQAQLTADRRSKIETRLRERSNLAGISRAIADVRLAINGAATAPFINANGKRFDDIELICRTGSKLEDFMSRASLPASGVTVTPINRPSASDLIAKLQAAEEAST